MLARLRGQQHRVITGVCLIPSRGRLRMEHVTTKVTMRAYDEAAVEAFIASGSPFDKAGGYAVQDAAFAPVEAYDGCYCNVLGLPLWTAIEMLQDAGVRPPEEQSRRGSPAACDGCFTKPTRAGAPR
jgi:predicted house-cleaning NTP pyrophosphatase (Maf/HAM1 superfamily)